MFLGFPKRVVQEVPVEGVDAAIGVAGGAALPALEALGGVVEQDLARHAEGAQRVRAPSSIRVTRGGESGVTSTRPPTGCSGGRRRRCHAWRGRYWLPARSALTRLDHLRVRGMRVLIPARNARSLAGLIGDELDLRGGCLWVQLEPRKQGQGVDEGQLVRALMADPDAGAIGRDGDSGGVGRASVNVVEKHGGPDGGLVEVDEREGIGVHPAAFDLGGGEVKPRQDMCTTRASLPSGMVQTARAAVRSIGKQHLGGRRGGRSTSETSAATPRGEVAASAGRRLVTTRVEPSGVIAAANGSRSQGQPCGVRDPFRGQ